MAVSPVLLKHSCNFPIFRLNGPFKKDIASAQATKTALKGKNEAAMQRSLWRVDSSQASSGVLFGSLLFCFNDSLDVLRSEKALQSLKKDRIPLKKGLKKDNP